MSQAMADQQRQARGSKAIDSLSGTLNKNFFEIEDLEDEDLNDRKTPIVNHNETKNQKKGYHDRRHKKNVKLQPFRTVDHHKIDLTQILSQKKQQQQKVSNISHPEPNVYQKFSYQFEIQSEDSEQQPSPQSINSVSKTVEQPEAPEVLVFEKHSQRQNAASYDDPRTCEDRVTSGPAEKIRKLTAIQSIRDPPSPRSQENQQNQRELQHGTNRDPELEKTIFIKDRKIFTVKRDREWLNRFWPQFYFHLEPTNYFTLGAKQTGNNSSITFILSRDKNIYEENSPEYLGKVKANFTGTLVNVFGKGYNPKDYIEKNLPLRQLRCTIEYETNFFGERKPRSMKVYVIKKGISYYDLEGTSKGGEQIPLNDLHKLDRNKGKIYEFKNRKPEWNDQIKGYMLYFGGRAKLASIKNFILEDRIPQNPTQPPQTRLLFGKTEEDQFRVQFGEIIDDIVGAGIILSTFGGKIGCQ